MTAITTPNNILARRSLLTDGIFCVLCGLVFALGAQPISAISGIDSALPLLILGVGTGLYGAGLFAYAWTRPVDRRLTLTIMVLNIGWIVGSIALLVFDPLTLTTEGKWIVLIVGDIVALLAAWQFVAARRMR
jgi:hypothetical protein